MLSRFMKNSTPKMVLFNMFLAFVSLFANGFGIYLTIQAGIGAAPWDVFNIGLSNSFHILYGTASIAVSITILVIDILLKEPIGIAMIIDAITVGKAVDFFNYINIIPTPKSLPGSIIMMVVGLLIVGYTQSFYMAAALGCGPRDTLLVAMKRRMRKIPIGLLEVMLMCVVTLAGFLLGGPVGIGTLMCAFGSGPSMQLALFTLRMDATAIPHQNIFETARVLFMRKNNGKGGS